MRRICDSSRHWQSSALSALRGLEVVAERLLDHDPGALGEPGVVQAARTTSANSDGGISR